MSRKNPKAGRGKCPTCGSTVLYRTSPASGRLGFTCDECDSSGYAEPGGGAHAKWSGTITQPTPSGTPPAGGDPKGDVPPAPKPPSGGNPKGGLLMA